MHLYDAGVFLVSRLSTDPHSGWAMLLYLLLSMITMIMIITCCCTYCQCQWEIILTMKLPITMIMITITGTITKTPIPILEEPCFITFCYQWKQWYDNNNNSGDNNLFSPSIVTLPLILERISSGGKTCTENSWDDCSRKYNITNSATPRCQN